VVIKIGIDWMSGGKDTLSCALEFPILFRSFDMKSNLVITMVLFAVAMVNANVAGAATVYKCSGPSGTVFQQEPCADAKAESRMNVEVASGAIGNVNSADREASNRYYREAMARGDLNTAAAFATSEKQKNVIVAKQTRKDLRCANMRTRAVQARADSKQLNGRWQHAADAKEAIYNNNCN
jgi:hypothetical protein